MQKALFALRRRIFIRREGANKDRNRNTINYLQLMHEIIVCFLLYFKASTMQHDYLIRFRLCTNTPFHRDGISQLQAESSPHLHGDGELRELLQLRREIEQLHRLLQQQP